MIYLASPYTHPNPAVREQRFRDACQATADLIRAGHVVYAPIVHSHHLVACGLPSDWEFWSRQDVMFLEIADEVIVLMLNGWQTSVGVREEVRLAEEMGIPVSYRRKEKVLQSVAWRRPVTKDQPQDIKDRITDA